MEHKDDDYPCDDCPMEQWCDGWEAMFCCVLCEYYGMKHCDTCDPWDI